MANEERRAAQLRGYKRYRTGTACAQGHNAERYVSTGACVECANQAAMRYRTGYARRRLLLEVSLPLDYPYALEDALRAALLELAATHITTDTHSYRVKVQSPEQALLDEWEQLSKP